MDKLHPSMREVAEQTIEIRELVYSCITVTEIDKATSSSTVQFVG